jgi:hypothetical protein
MSAWFRVLYRIEVQGIGTDVLLMGPHNRPIPHPGLHEISYILKLPEHPEFKKRSAIVNAVLAIGKFKMKLVIR